MPLYDPTKSIINVIISLISMVPGFFTGAQESRSLLIRVPRDYNTGTLLIFLDPLRSMFRKPPPMNKFQNFDTILASAAHRGYDACVPVTHCIPEHLTMMV
jgi:hypothetical protein